ncbi:MAG: type IX secretion system membrane protein PorP/SprF, partial [Cytophagaceae bacterium]|nr:type IX secretion system membrane protein PorP/SprF [Cytophagaceae bacterium]MCU0431781.1 type IX secretion system membrane protein PorP/SprF [Cytophagaceae bacterium]
VMLRYYPSRPLYYLVNAGLEFNQTVTAGLSYASPSTIGIYGLVGLSPKLKFGYRYELIRGGFQIGNFSSNELTMVYGF